MHSEAELDSIIVSIYIKKIKKTERLQRLSGQYIFYLIGHFLTNFFVQSFTKYFQKVDAQNNKQFLNLPGVGWCHNFACIS